MDSNTTVTGLASGYTHTITEPLSCDTTNCVYYWRFIKTNCVDYPNCEYVGMTTRQFKDRLAEHRDYPKRDVVTEPAGEHFTKPGYGVHHLRGQALERVRNKDPYVLKAREHMLIQKFYSYRNGLNQEP